MRHISLFTILLLSVCLQAQSSNEYFSNPKMEEVLLGNFDPAEYRASEVIDLTPNILRDLVGRINPDTLKYFIAELSLFENRNTGADTLSPVRGMGAARDWCLNEFDRFDRQNEGRLETGFFVFDQVVCGMGRHKNILAVLPGQGPNRNEVDVVLAHLDSRCDDPCDIDCRAHGIEDNGSGSAAVLELARTMSKYTFNRTMAFMLTTGEEQGLIGAAAFANYCADNGIEVHTAFNNDIIGGIICGATASPPGCPGLNHIDSINMRVYSQGGTNSKHKMLARWIEQNYNDHVAPLMPVRNIINIMTPEDRTGRSGDHVAFRRNGFTTIRFCAANEHGDGNPSQPGYSDRQHTHDDVMGLDTDNDGIIDSFFVDFNYLARNSLINAGSMIVASEGPSPIENIELGEVPGGFWYEITDSVGYDSFRIGVRKIAKNTFDTTFITQKLRDTVFIQEPFFYYVSASTFDQMGLESLICQEERVRVRTSLDEYHFLPPVELLQNFPNPFDEATTIAVNVNRAFNYKNAEIRVTHPDGRILARLPISLNLGDNEVVYSYEDHGYQPGAYYYSLWVDDEWVATKMMIYAF